MEVTSKTQDEIDNARDIENLKRVEAALFISGRFISLAELVVLTDLNPILLNHSLNELQERYGEESAIEVVKKGEMWKMDVKSDFMDIVNRLASGSEEFTKAEQETLAVIAHKHPISQAKIILMRGNKAYDHIKKFVSLGLIKSKKLGRTRELDLSEEFYNYFSVKKNDLDSKDKNRVKGENKIVGEENEDGEKLDVRVEEEQKFERGSGEEG